MIGIDDEGRGILVSGALGDMEGTDSREGGEGIVGSEVYLAEAEVLKSGQSYIAR